MTAYRERTNTALGHQGEEVAISPVVAPPHAIGELVSWSIDVGNDGLSDARRASMRRARVGRIWFGLIGGLGAFLFATLAVGASLAAAAGLAIAITCYGLGGWLVRARRGGALPELRVDLRARRLRSREQLDELGFREWSDDAVRRLRVYRSNVED